jgi:hypothetical protein
MKTALSLFGLLLLLQLFSATAAVPRGSFSIEPCRPRDYPLPPGCEPVERSQRSITSKYF